MKRKLFFLLFFLFISLGTMGQPPGGPGNGGGFGPGGPNCTPPPCIPTMNEWMKFSLILTGMGIGVYFLRKNV